MSSDLKKFVLDFLKNTGLTSKPVEFKGFSGDGSDRSFWRISLSQSGQYFIAMANPPVNRSIRQENLACLMIANHLRSKRIPVPEIYQYDLENGWFIMEDLGQTSLQDLVSSKKNPLPDYENVLEHLFRLQIEGAKGFDPSWCCQTARYDRTVMRQNESNYFRDAFLFGYLGLKKEWPELEGPFDHLADISSSADADFFIHRVFQSRNIIISAKGDIGIVDWQGGRFGPLGYDLASLINDPYTGLSHKQKNELLQSYIRIIKQYNAGWVESFKKTFIYLAIQRNLQILGAFSFLTIKKKKERFEDYILPAQKTLQELLEQANDPRLSPIADVLRARA